jgi:hypothetical protein
MSEREIPEKKKARLENEKKHKQEIHANEIPEKKKQRLENKKK